MFLSFSNLIPEINKTGLQSNTALMYSVLQVKQMYIQWISLNLTEAESRSIFLDLLFVQIKTILKEMMLIFVFGLPVMENNNSRKINAVLRFGKV